MTHELRTPITVASSAIDVLLNHRGLSDQLKTRKYLQASKEELLHLDHLVEKILNLAVEDKDDIKLNYEKLNLKHIFSTLVKNHSLIHSKEVNFHLDLNPIDNDIYLDRLHFSNALNNIIDNAIKYTKAPVDIHINGTMNQTELQLSIGDNGPGIEKEHQAAIFEPFYRVPTGDLHNVKGFGLGLSYVKKIIQKHGGSIDIKSQYGKGSTFIITIPMMNNHV
jgi:signal transduction histidine kinase